MVSPLDEAYYWNGHKEDHNWKTARKRNQTLFHSIKMLENHNKPAL